MRSVFLGRLGSGRRWLLVDYGVHVQARWRICHSLFVQLSLGSFFPLGSILGPIIRDAALPAWLGRLVLVLFVRVEYFPEVTI